MFLPLQPDICRVSCLCWGWDIRPGVSKTDVVWTTVKTQGRKRSSILNAIPIISKDNAEMDGALIIYHMLGVPLPKQGCHLPIYRGRHSDGHAVREW